jgi:hypothetical protein
VTETHRHGLTSVECTNSRLGLCVIRKFDKCTTYKKIHVQNKTNEWVKTDKSIHYTKNVYWIPPFLWDHHSWCQMGTTPSTYEVITLDGDKPLLRGHHSWWRHLVECYHLSSPAIWSDKIDGLWWEGAYKETTLYVKTWTMNIFLCKIFISLRK